MSQYRQNYTPPPALSAPSERTWRRLDVLQTVLLYLFLLFLCVDSDIGRALRAGCGK